jgi:hypothetical protein
MDTLDEHADVAAVERHRRATTRLSDDAELLRCGTVDRPNLSELCDVRKNKWCGVHELWGSATRRERALGSPVMCADGSARDGRGARKARRARRRGAQQARRSKTESASGARRRCARRFGACNRGVLDVLLSGARCARERVRWRVRLWQSYRGLGVTYWRV